MRNFTIADLETYSDIKAHTFRVWEQRYDLCRPARSGKNLRLYNLEQLKELLDISLLHHLGFKISHLVRLGQEGIMKTIREHKSEEVKRLWAVNKLLVSMFAKDTEQFETILNESIAEFGIGTVINDVIIPFIERVGLLYYNERTPEVHFVVTAVRQKLILGLESLKPNGDSPEKVLFFLPYREHYDLILLYMIYLVKDLGYRTLYLGTDIPAECLKTVCEEKKPSHVITYLAPKAIFDLQEVVQFLQSELPEVKLVLTGFTNKIPADILPPCVMVKHYSQIPEVFNS